MRWTKSPRQALDRLAEKWPDALPSKGGKPVRRLGYALDVLKRRHVLQREVQETIRWHGIPPLDGIPGWIHDALMWGRSDRPAVRRIVERSRSLGAELDRYFTPEKRTTCGRCISCRKAYEWEAGPRRRLKQAHCPECGRHLAQTTRSLRSVPWDLETLPVFTALGWQEACRIIERRRGVAARAPGHR